MMKQLRMIKMTGLLPVLLWLYSCGGAEQSPAEPPVDVDFIALTPGNASVEKKYPGTIEGSVDVAVKAQVTGYLDQIYVKEGDYVQKGQPLFRIKGDVYQEQVNNSKAAYETALASERQAAIEVEKIKPLVAGMVYTEQHLQTAEASHAAAKAQVAQARAAWSSSEINAAFSLIKAPVSGYIGRIPGRTGNLVTPADAVPLTTLSEIKQVYVYFSISEADFLAFVKESERDTAATLILADGTVYPVSGRIEMASGNIDKYTGSMVLKAVFDNPERILRSGGSGKIVLRKTLQDVLLMPMAGVRDIQDRYFIFTLSDSNTVVMKPLEVKGRSGQHYIIRSGAVQGDKVAVNRIDALRDGMTVKPSVKTE